jgi:hypothetical protein
MRRSWPASQPPTHLLDKHPGYSHHVGTIKSFLPKARFIHLIRDGRDVAASMMAVHKKMGFAPAQIAEAAGKWKKFVVAARAAAQFGDEYLEIRYEDFLEGREEIYGKVLDFCGLPYTPDWISETLAANTFEKMKSSGASPDQRTKLSEKRYHRGKAGGWKEDFSGWQRYEFDRIAGDLLVELGYAKPGWWAETAGDRFVQPLRRRWRKRAPFLSRALRDLQAALLGNKGVPR